MNLFYNLINSIKRKNENKKFYIQFCKKRFHISTIYQHRKKSICLNSIQNNSSVNNNICIVKSEKQEIDKNNSDFIQYVFKWGIGNKFRSDPENRYHPVHLKRSKEVTIRKDYFDNVNENIRYEELNEQWEVYWFENNKLNAKPFPVKKFGINDAKREAIKFYESLKVQQRIMPKPKYESGVEGVHYDIITNCWVAFYRSNNFPVCRSFSAEYHGFETAKQMAIERVEKHKK
ncbi:hypothetical protein PFAG_03246 [Plasmodium falciparum Santa Lucia]|uniref:AP2 domain transcription factor, putative n=12 Tax=Plasmodium falciparum TaxID=5833 RepID=Q8IIK9_PLAF7|nr:AP2 domain transcription factor, putative [Plasmodium falciparum 3D7]ETW29291.1 hypothetical protein PFFCH_03282 [Plasmodium falciparum FCH/4]ETW36061.1 hypothetical protein PFTANZ_03285 [Plasmodium falciparum Tanzania (2000708)]ETW41916.1 hypothetical protein PFNF135_03414 [Plasmodium falciparum NF135/5.C10]ETW48689.1 hypothetical protein PFMALIP_03227 [Plasmodium falciparum MaliPS096_E11]ETW52780.1 hypothetical protein PFUGPA_05088 [Plasmodium falciparum Palo Alto/Uganda]EUR70093.1 hypot|eukprot:XP_001347834.1 transcription factor with AP2 domain(s),putative [Plasmodium falciparum 3D7]